MDMYPSGSSKILQIENEDINLQIFVDDLDKLTENRRINMNTPALVKYSSNRIETKLYTIVDNNKLVENNGIHMLPVFFENGDYEVILESNKEKNLSFIQNGINIDKYFKSVSNLTIGSLKFRSDVGYTNLDIYESGKKILSLIIEVFPSKMDYKKDYEEMIWEINEEIASIAFTLLDKTYLEGQLVDSSNQTKTEFINILEYIFEDFIKSLDYIVENFKHNIIEKERIISTDKAKRISKKTKKYLRTRPYLLKEHNDGFIYINNKNYMPKKIIELRKETTIDIFENQLVKYMIRDIIRRIEYLEKVLIQAAGKDYKILIEDKYSLTNKKKKLNFYLKKYFRNIKDIGPKDSMSLVFKMSTGYKEAYKKYKILSKGLDLGDDLFKISPKKIYELYEMWSYIKLHKILYNLGYKVKQYGIIDYKDNGLYLRLNTDKEASMIYENDKQSLRLWYNKSYLVPTTRQRPDTVLYIENLNSKQKRTYLFDAKYRMKIDHKGKESPLEEDINIMHRYRDAIVSEMNGGLNYKYETFGAYVMFPCSDEEEFKEHKFYKTIDKVNIGAFPMLPGSTSLITNHLKNILNQSDLEAKESRLVLDEFDNYAKFKKEDVMVVNSIDRIHLNAFLKYNFFHIAKEKLSSVRLGVEYIAFYQPKTSFKEESGIYYYAKIDRTYDYLKSDCKELEISSNKNKSYLRFELKDIKKISRIEAYEIGPKNFYYTTYYLLHNAENMRELKIKSNLEMRVYKVLKKIGDEKGIIVKKEGDSSKNIEKYSLGNKKIEIIEGKYIRVAGENVKYRDFESHIN